MSKKYYLYNAKEKEIIGPVTKSQAMVMNGGMASIHATDQDIEHMRDALRNSSQLEQGVADSAEGTENQIL